MSDVAYDPWASTIDPSTGRPRLTISPAPVTQLLGAGGQGDDLLGRYGEAIARIESGGKYDTLGPTTYSGDRAYGKYQVMGSNVGPWTKEALGRELTPSEFLASPQAQDAVFRHKFGQYVSRYGNASDAASAWFTGGPQSSGASKSDVLGTTGSQYVDRFNAALGQPSNLLASTPQAKQASGVEQLLGLNGVPRYQLWPERLVRSALEAPQQAMSGQLGVPGSREFSENAIAPAQAMAALAGGGSIPAAMGERGALGVLGGKLTVPQAGQAAPTFYSSAMDALQRASFGRASAQQWLGYLRNSPGVKAEELDWMGTPEWLQGQQGPVSKFDLAAHMQEQSPQLQEVAHQKLSGPLPQVVEDWLNSHPNQYAARDVREAIREGSRQVPFEDAISMDAPENVQSALWKHLNPTTEPKFASDTLPGASPGSYKEALLTLPERADTRPQPQWPYSRKQIGGPNPVTYRSSHWDEPNVLAHVRMNDREVTPASGGKPLKTMFLEEVQSDWHQAGRRQGYGEGGVPNAPFKTSWPELALKRMIREAAEQGYDAIAWTPGEVQAARYDLSKQLREVIATRAEDGTYALGGKDHAGKFHEFADAVPESKLSDYVGKDLAEKIAKNEDDDAVYKGVDLKVGGEGMLKFYDDMLPNVANKLGKKYGARVEQGTIRSSEGTPTSHGRMRDMSVHVLRITPELRQRALSQGFPLFSAGVPLSVAGSDGRIRTLHPVNHDPFSDEGLRRGESL